MSKAEFYDLLRSDMAGYVNLSSEQAERRCQTIMDYCRLGGLIHRGFAECEDTSGGRILRILYMPRKNEDLCICAVFKITEKRIESVSARRV